MAISQYFQVFVYDKNRIKTHDAPIFRRESIRAIVCVCERERERERGRENIYIVSLLQE